MGLLFVAALRLASAQDLQTIAFAPPTPVANQSITAIVPFEICAWTVVTSEHRIDINWITAPCAAESFTDRVDLGMLPPGQYDVYLNLVGGAMPIEQAFGSLGVANAIVSPLPTLGRGGFIGLCVGLMILSLLYRRTFVRSLHR
jgi:hypothetical protein